MFPSLIARSQLDAMVELAASTPDGAFCEIGVFQGGSAYRLYEVALKQSRELHLFDTFTGTPVFREGLDKHNINDEFAAPEAPKYIQHLMPLAKIHQGIYPQTHPPHLARVAFVHCDCDQYESYNAVIGYMWPCMVAGAVMLFDDYPYLNGAKLAVEERFTKDQLLKCGQRYYVRKEKA